MIDGITIIDKIPETDMPSWGFYFGIIIFISTIIFGVIKTWVNKKKDTQHRNPELFSYGFLGFALGLCFFGLSVVLFPENTGEYQYKVIINKSVSFIDVYDKYNVLDHKGEYYIVKPKELIKGEER